MSHVQGADDGSGYGVYGWSNRRGYGVVGESLDNIAVYGTSASSIGVSGSSDSDSGVYGRSNSRYGVQGDSYSGYGVLGRSNTAYGVVGVSNKWIGVHGYSDSSYGVSGYSDSNTGVIGQSFSGFGVYAKSNSAYGVLGESSNNIGVYGTSTSRYGVLGESLSSYGVYARSQQSYALYADSSEGYAAYLKGEVTVDGRLIKRGGGFKIDHPLDPANKYLSHSFVESPDMKNVYDGVVVLDDKGEAVIDLPDWFAALNKDFRYQLTAIGAPGPNLYIAQEISDGATNYDSSSSSNNNKNSCFKIAGGTPSMKVSWQVTGIRKDPWANANRIEVEEDKPDKERGYYLHPDVYGKPEEKGISHLLFPPQEGEEKKLQEEQQIINK